MFRVHWSQSAVDELSTIWTNADPVLRQAITSAAFQIDEHLRSDPYGQSESRPGGIRVLFVAPLGINFRVEAGTKTSLVLRIWLFRKRDR